jgi:hypothetical protein
MGRAGVQALNFSCKFILSMRRAHLYKGSAIEQVSSRMKISERILFPGVSDPVDHAGIVVTHQ